MKFRPVLLPASTEFAPTFQGVDFLRMACVVLVEPSVSKLPETPFKLKSVNSFEVPPVNRTAPIAVLVMSANLLDPEIVSAPVPPWFSVGKDCIPAPVKIFADALVRLIIPEPVNVVNAAPPLKAPLEVVQTIVPEFMAMVLGYCAPVLKLVQVRE